MKRQGVIVTISELRELADKLEKERLELFKKANCDPIRLDMHKFQINIINKEGLSDTWEIENHQ